jgi:DNA/RNA-binding domain of Phe-tRNA-synthetase-like protein
MRFVVQPEVFARFPGIRIAAATASGLDNRAPRPQVEVGWRAAWATAMSAAQYGNAQSHPCVKLWREQFTAMGVSGKEFPSSVEALLRRALKGGEPFVINPLVDWYNTISLRHLVPAGAFDLADIHGTLELRLTQPGDTFTSLDADVPLAVPPGEVAYADGHIILTRHFVWRQARSGLVTPETRDVVLVSEVLGEVGAEAAAAVVADFQRGLREYFGLDSQGWIVDAAHPAVDW